MTSLRTPLLTTLAALLLAISCFFAPTAKAAVYDEMMTAVKLGDRSAVVELLNRGMDVNTSDIEGNTLLMLAARENHPELVALFIGQRAKINARNMHGDSALRLAAYAGRLVIVQRLVEAGAQIEMEGWTPLIYAAFNGHTEVVEYLLAQGANLNAVSESGMTALMAAARGGYTDLAKRLVTLGADINLKDSNGRTALDWATRTRNTTIADFLRAQEAK
ncbi:MAG: ankyrin repeat domain-containing protein [Zoogloeaceae bacterium]|jgi:ankyrin repeat protein|nr:ankyrin repeat domain-containing protein [Zoogloeaceae bacterium]